MSFLVTVLAFLHIAAAMGWMGGALLFVSAIAPGIRSVQSAPATMEVLARIGPRAVRFFAGTATSTIIFGLALLAVLPGLATISLIGGVAFGLLAYITAILTFLSLRKASNIARRTLAGPPGTHPPPAMVQTLRRGGLTNGITVLLLILALIFMVGTGFPI